MLDFQLCYIMFLFHFRVFNTVTKSLGQHLNPTVSPAVSWTFITDCFAKMLRTVVKALDICVDEDLIVTGMHWCLAIIFLCSALYCTGGSPYLRVIRSKTYHGYVKPWIIPNAIYNVI